MGPFFLVIKYQNSLINGQFNTSKCLVASVQCLLTDVGLTDGHLTNRPIDRCVLKCQLTDDQLTDDQLTNGQLTHLFVLLLIDRPNLTGQI
jgi:hypothetical protein